MSIVPQIEADQASRVGYKSRVTFSAPSAAPRSTGEVQPGWLAFTAFLGSIPLYSGIRWVGTWLNCSFRYVKPGSKIPAYLLTAAVLVSNRGQVKRVFLRSCSCPDGLARTGRTGAERHCKHMIALEARLHRLPASRSESLIAGAWAADQAQYEAAA